MIRALCFLALVATTHAFLGANLPLAASRSCRQTSADLQMSLDRRDVLRTGLSIAASTVISRLPAFADDAADWMEVEDPATGKTYWYNTKTQKTSFEDPKGAPAAAASPSDSSEAKSERPKISKMGGQLDSYKDINKGFSLYRPSGWNQFDAAPGEYDIKWEDIVEKSELIMVGSSAVKTATSVSALGPVDKVGASLAAKKKAELVEAKERTTDGVLYYSFQFKAGDQKTGFRELYELCVNKGKLWSLTATTSEKRWAKRQELYNNIMLSFQPRL